MCPFRVSGNLHQSQITIPFRSNPSDRHLYTIGTSFTSHKHQPCRGCSDTIGALFVSSCVHPDSHKTHDSYSSEDQEEVPLVPLTVQIQDISSDRASRAFWIPPRPHNPCYLATVQWHLPWGLPPRIHTYGPQTTRILSITLNKDHLPERTLRPSQSTS